MDIITLVRIVIWLTFFLLIAEGIGLVIFIPRAVKIYIARHQQLIVRVDSIERRLNLLEGNDHAHNAN